MSSEQGSLDRHLPVYPHCEVHELMVAAGPEAVGGGDQVESTYG